MDNIHFDMELTYSVHSPKTFYNSFQIERNTIVATVFHFIMNQIKFHLVQKSKGKLLPQSYSIQFERSRKYIFVSLKIDFPS